jgi:hypothetical protein
MGKEEEKREGQISLYRWGYKPPSYFYLRWRQVKKKKNEIKLSVVNEMKHTHIQKKTGGFLLERIRRRRRRRKNLCVCVCSWVYTVSGFLCERVQEKVGPPRGVGRPKMLRALCCCCSSCRGASTRCTGKCINSLHFKPSKTKTKREKGTQKTAAMTGK